MYLPDFLSKIGYQRTFCLHMAVKKHSDLKLVKLGSDTNFLFGLRSEAGVCARRRSNFLSRRRKKVTKERATLLSVTPTLRAGATCDARSRGAPWNSLRANALHSDNHGESDNKGVCPSAHARPAPCASRHGQKGTQERGPSLRSAPDARRTVPARIGPSAAKACLDVLAVGLSHPFWMRLGRSTCGVACALVRACFVNWLAVAV